VLAVPVAWVAVSYARLARLRLVLLFAVAQGLTWGLLAAWWNAHTACGGWLHMALVRSALSWISETVPNGLKGALILTALTWAICYAVRGRVIVELDYLCPKCRYSLIGNTSGSCPECGHAYTLGELGVAAGKSGRNAER
jgi:hypothetical protein